MKIGLLGTGTVGRTLAAKLVQLDHEVAMGSRGTWSPEAQAWLEAAGSLGRLATFAGAAAFGELLINATAGAGSLDALASCNPGSLDRKILLDVSNPLDFSRGFPPTLSIVNTDSLGERIQAAHPELRVVKTFNSLNPDVMVQPSLLRGHHSCFICGNDGEAKATVAQLEQSFGWPAEDILDLGDITAARGTEMLFPLALALFRVVGSPRWNLNVVRG